MHLVTETTELNSKKKLVVLDNGQFKFPLYNAEIKRYGIVVGDYIEDGIFDKLMNEVIYERCKNRALHIITRRDISENALREKLALNYYPDYIIDKVICFVCEHRLIDDDRYAGSYVYSKADCKSKKQIEEYLKKHGVSSETINKAIEEYYGNNEGAEEKLIKELIIKKRVVVSQLTYEEKQKLLAYLARKGFDFGLINKVIDEMRQEEISN